MELKFIAGQEVWDALQIEKKQKVSQNAEGYFNSRELIPLQSEWSSRGIVGAEIVESVRVGWTLRYDSGIRNWAIISAGMTREEVEYRAVQWCAVDPTKRYVFEKV